MKEPVLVIMAAGMGSRFGGLKQIASVDEAGHPIIDFSMYDAYRAGFRDVVFIIKKENHQIFEETVFEYDILKQRFRETAFLTKGLKINLFDLREGMEQNHSFHYEGGIKEFVSYLNHSRTPLYENIFYATGEKDGVLVEVAFQHNDGFTESIFTFVNNINTPDGGTHLVGFKAGLTKTLNDYGKKIGIIKDADTIKAAMSEYVDKRVKKDKEKRPSIRKQLRRLSRKTERKDPERNRKQERSR